MEKIKLNINSYQEKSLPSNLEAEQALIGSVLVNNDIIDEIASDLGYVDEEQLKADKEDAEYQKFKDDRLG